MCIFSEVQSELDYQEKKWGHSIDDMHNTPFNWMSYIAQYSTRWMRGSFPPFQTSVADDFRTCMIKVAAIAISAVESLDRQRAANGNAFYEVEKLPAPVPGLSSAVPLPNSDDTGLSPGYPNLSAEQLSKLKDAYTKLEIYSKVIGSEEQIEETKQKMETSNKAMTETLTNIKTEC